MTDTGKKPTVLIILDGWGYREDTRDNAIANADTPVWDRLWSEAPHTLVSGSGLDVGLPAGQMGNSEVGHMSLGAGRVIFQNITRIDQAIADGSFEQNPAYTSAIDKAIAANGAVHVFGLLVASTVTKRRFLPPSGWPPSAVQSAFTCMRSSTAATPPRAAPMLPWKKPKTCSPSSIAAGSPAYAVATTQWIETIAGIASPRLTRC
jgi:hypothetical protein